ncbi:hypothetical protein [Burkholderia multivorans]|uniref:hypothetical protein n=1 Tax=Burkholderia multivorans TaxID=87883 RepID=UPI001C225602|nr:hypothetical protein [Burkholderia multivorans]
MNRESERAAFESMKGAWQSMPPFDVFCAGWRAARAASANETGAEGVQERVGTVEIIDGRVRSYTFEQTDTPDGRYALYTAPRSPAVGAEPVAQWQSRLKDRSSPVVDRWVNISPDGAKTLMEKYPNVYEVRALYAAPQPSAQAGAREGLTDEQRSTLESLARTSTPYEQEVLRSILAAHPGQPEPADCGETLPGEYTNADDLIASLREPEPRECRHCGWMCIPNSTPSKTMYPLAQPEPRDEVTEEQPSLTNPLTPYGMLVRALRIVAQTSLYDMGQALLLSPAKLSAMEFGREPVTPEIVREVGTYFESLGLHNMRPALQFAVDTARTGDAHE